jgi:hypothetical protein
MEILVSFKRRHRDGSDKSRAVKRSGNPLVIVGAIIILDQKSNIHGERGKAILSNICTTIK